MSIQSDIRSKYFLLPFSISALKPIGLLVKERIYFIPSLKSYPCTNVRLTGCTIAMPPPSDAAATSSGLEHGYIAPQMIGYSALVCFKKVLRELRFIIFLLMSILSTLSHHFDPLPLIQVLNSSLCHL